MPGPVILDNRTPRWLKPENASVTDSAVTKAIRLLATLTGANDPQSQVLALMNPMIPRGQETAGPLATALQKVIRAFHGSPHDFDRFDMSKIGTGEGAQAYGHGLYFAENEGVARNYRDTLSGVGVQPNISVDPEAIKKLGMRAGDGFGSVEQYIRNAVRESKGDLKRAASNLRNGATQQMSAAEHFDATFKARAKLFHDQAHLAADLIDRGAVMVEDNPGRMYEVAIHADPEQFLDWDKPLSQQPAAVRQLVGYPEKVASASAAMDRKAEELTIRMSEIVQRPGAINDRGFLAEGSAKDEYNRIGQALAALNERRRELYGMQQMTGADAYRAGASSPADVSAALKARGIPGIKYLDQGSRAAGEGSRNYVVFDDRLVSILKKYGVALPVIEGLRRKAQTNDGRLPAADVEQVITQ